MTSDPDRFTVTDLRNLSELVGKIWLSAANEDWSVKAGTLEWSCLNTADHAVDCVYAPAFFLASRRTDSYPEVGLDLTLGARANPAMLVQSLEIATRLLAGVVNDAEPSEEAIIFRRPTVILAPPADFVPRGALELVLHAHDVCIGLGVAFEPPAELCQKLREHTRHWPLWTSTWSPLGNSIRPWHDLLLASGRSPQSDMTL
jgi:hypothetical protein